MEKALSRLMPVSIGDCAQGGLDAMIDDLAGESEPPGSLSKKASGWLVVTGIAAALGLGAFLTISKGSDD